jgi:predicted dehydrogenase
LPVIVVELDSQRNRVKKMLTSVGCTAELITIPDKERDNFRLSAPTEATLTRVLRRHSVEHAIISTEPKAHMAYARFFLQNEIHVLMDKPLSAPQGASRAVQPARQVYQDYKELLSLVHTSKTGAKCIIQSQRRYHWGYRLIDEVAKKFCLEYETPVTYAGIYHSDGLWNMPTEYQSRENHPYKYGYGKLLHSGYHFIDLFSYLTRHSRLITGKVPNSVAVAYQKCSPDDCLAQVDRKLYERLFPDRYADFFHTLGTDHHKGFGETDSHLMLQLRKDDCVMTSASLNLLQNGFSRRAWPNLPIDTYKGNGRVRHEQVTLQFGPFMSVQVHSYEAVEKRAQFECDDLYSVGGTEHFEVFIFRNSAVIGGKSVEIFSNRDQIQHEHSLGHNEEAREQCLMEFLSLPSGAECRSDLKVHHFTNFLLSEVLVASARSNDRAAGCAIADLPVEVLA